MLRPREELKVYARVFDNYTFENLIYLADHGIFRSLAFPISSGKEAEAYTAWRDKELITLKIYKIETLNYHKLKDLLLADYRFSKNLKLSRRAIVEAWARKEFTNLSIAYEAKVRVPRPIAVCKNVIAMQFIGSLSGPAPLLLKAEI
ncbi:MAG: RIO1 family regulatory kinase/ATPase, partial [archaeon]